MGGGLMQLLLLVGVFVIFYGMLIIPERKRRKNYSNMLAELKIGDKALTRGGLIGRIVSVEDDRIVLETEPDNIKLTFSKQGISSLLTEESNM